MRTRQRQTDGVTVATAIDRIVRRVVIGGAALVVTAGLAVSGGGVVAATISVDSLAPAVAGDDLANLGADSGGSMIWSDRPVVGQTFTTGSNPGGYELSALTVQVGDSDGTVTGWKDFRVRVNTITVGGPTATPLLDTVIRYESDFASNSFLTFNFDSPIALASDTLYGFDIGVSASRTGWSDGIPSLRRTASAYAGGQLYSGPKINTFTTDSTTSISLGSDDLVFAAAMAPVAVPEPAGLALLVPVAAAAVAWAGRRRRVAG